MRIDNKKYQQKIKEVTESSTLPNTNNGSTESCWMIRNIFEKWGEASRKNEGAIQFCIVNITLKERKLQEVFCKNRRVSAEKQSSLCCCCVVRSNIESLLSYITRWTGSRLDLCKILFRNNCLSKSDWSSTEIKPFRFHEPMSSCELFP